MILVCMLIKKEIWLHKSNGMIYKEYKKKLNQVQKKKC